jgi:hypothetical protein
MKIELLEFEPDMWELIFVYNKNKSKKNFASIEFIYLE